MDLSKFNISSTAKENLRRRFFDSRSIKRKKFEESDSTSTDTLSNSEESPRSGEERAEPKVKRERTLVPKPRPSVDVSCVEEDDGFPLITSVYSLATCVGGRLHQEGYTSSDGSSDNMAAQQLPSVKTESIENQAMSTKSGLSGAATSNASFLPFVVQSTNGVITVCSPPRASPAATIYSHATTTQRDPTQATQFASSVVSSDLQAANILPEANGAFPVSTSGTPAVLPTSEHKALIQNSGVSAPIVSTSAAVTQPTFIPSPNQDSRETQPAELPQSDIPAPMVDNANEGDSSPSDGSTVPMAINATKGDSSQSDESTFNDRSSTLDTGISYSANTAISPAKHQSKSPEEKSEEALSSETPDYPSQEKSEGQPLVTKQDDRIRRLKDLLRKKEEELEKLRFRGKEDTTSPNTSATNQQLRIKLLKKNSDPCLHTQKSFVWSDSSSEGLLSKPTAKATLPQTEPSVTKEKQVSSEKELGSTIDTKVSSALKRKSGTPELERSVSTRNRAGQVTSPPPKKKNNEDKYRLVNVTVVKGHTRTLSVPVNKTETPTVSKQVKETEPKPDQTNDKKIVGTNARRKSDGTSARAIKVWRPAVCTHKSPMATVVRNVTEKLKDRVCTSEGNISSNKDVNTCVTQASKGNNSTASVSFNNSSSELNSTAGNVATVKVLVDHVRQTSNTSASISASICASKKLQTVVTQGSNPVSSPAKITPGIRVPLTSPAVQPVGSIPSQAAGNNLNAFITQASTVVRSGVLNSNPPKPNIAALQLPANTLLVNYPNKGSFVNPNIYAKKNPYIVLTKGGALSNSAPPKTNPSAVQPASDNVSLKEALENIQKQVFALASKTPSQGITPVGVTASSGQPSSNIITSSLVSRPLYTLAPKPPAKPNDKLLIYTFAKPAGAVAVGSTPPVTKPNDLGDGKLLLCNVVQPKIAPKPGQLFLSPVNNDKGKVVLYVSNPGAGQKLGIIKDNRVIFTSPSGKPYLPAMKSPVKSDNNSEFIPNPGDSDFTKLLGLEHVVCSLNTDR